MKEFFVGARESQVEKKESEPLKPRRRLFVTRDREKIIGVTTMSPDPRKETIRVRYAFETKHPKSTGARGFGDDHYRGINRYFQGGRDDRVFRVGRTPEANARFAEIQKSLQDLRSERAKLINNMSHSGIVYETEVSVSVDTKKSVIKVEDSNGNIQHEEIPTATLIWKAAETPYSTGTVISRRELTSEEATRAPIILEEAITQGPPETILETITERQDQFEQSAATNGLRKLETDIERLKNELDPYLTTEEAEITIDLYDPKDPEYKQLEQLLGEQESIAYDEDLPALDFLQFNDPKMIDSPLAPTAPLSKEARKQALIANFRKKYPTKIARSPEPPPTTIPELKPIPVEDPQKRKQRIEEELTPEMIAQIQTEVEELQATIRILQEIPSTDEEVRKIVKQLPVESGRSLSHSLKERTRGAEMLNEARTLRARIDQLIERTKFNEAFPKAKERTGSLLEKWRDIPPIVSSDDEARMLVEDGATTNQELVTRTREAFLRDPWNKDPKKVLKNILTDIIESIYTKHPA